MHAANRREEFSMFSFVGRHKRSLIAVAGVAVIAAVPLAFTSASAAVSGQGQTTCAGNGAGAVTCTGTFSGSTAYDPNTGQPTGITPTVTVQQTQGLAFQAVHVTWTGFTPSAAGDYDVGIYECRGNVDA